MTRRNQDSKNSNTSTEKNKVVETGGQKERRIKLSEPDARKTLLRLLSYMLKHKVLLGVSILFLILTGAIEAGFVKAIDSVLKSGFLNGDDWYVRWSGLMLIAVLAARAITGFIGNYSMAKTGRLVIFNLRQDIFKKMICLPTTFFDKTTSAQTISKLIYDVETTSVAITDTLSIMFRESFKALGLIAFLFWSEWRLTLIFMLVVPLVVLVGGYTNKRFRKTSKKIQGSMGGIGDTVKEAVVGQKVIKVYNGQLQEIENFTKANEFNLKQNLKRARVSSALVPITMLLVAPAIALILYIFLKYLRTGPESVVQFSTYIMACLALMSPLKRLAKVNEKIQVGVTAADSVFAMIDEVPELDSGSVQLRATNGQVSFESVSFKYRSDDDQPVLRAINIDIKPGERVALVGPSGSGKSTITSLILRFYSPQSGKISIDGIDVKDLCLKDLRSQVALVSQETTLFDDTIGRNIMYGMLDQYDEARLQAAIKAAHVDEFLAEMPDGLDTMVGESGLRLSGGQRQRVAIARAIYKNAPILILDEATSALDNKSERYVQDALETLMKGRTSLVIAHRLSTIESADNIIVLDRGKIVEQGPHKKLMKNGGVYAELHRAQTGNTKKGFFFWNR
ncbi:MAG: lipid A export permease/ATP-binding protein MsbA [Gammaproteobacteria bacterium]|nr:lipid A export permease/ATP-binding protein MsbA [Gammaproteobacteria bacterium]